LPVTTALFLYTTALTSATGFLFPIHGFTPALGVGILACVILAVALFALYKEHLAGAWRWIYVIGTVASLYLNVFVLVVQSFVKVSASMRWLRRRLSHHSRSHRPLCWPFSF